MKCVCLKTFRDLQSNRLVHGGEVFEASAKRLEEINGTRYGELAKAVKGMRSEAAEEAVEEATEEAAEEVAEDDRG